MSRFEIVAMLLLMLGLTASVGCSTLNKPYPEKSVYGLELPAAKAKAVSNSDRVLRLRKVRVDDAFNQRAMVWLQSGGVYETDFYHVLIADPGSLLAGAARQYLDESGPYAAVVGGASSVTTSDTLEAWVSRFYGDQTDAAAPQAVIEATFYLVDESEGDARLIMRETYSASIPLDSDASAELVAGWSRAWARVLGEVAADLAEQPHVTGKE